VAHRVPEPAYRFVLDSLGSIAEHRAGRHPRARARAVVVDAQPLEGRRVLESLAGKLLAALRVGPVGPGVHDDPVMPQLTGDLDGSELYQRPQVRGDPVLVGPGDDRDVDVVAVAFATRPRPANQLAGWVVHQPPV